MSDSIRLYEQIVSIYTVKKVAEVFGVSPDYIINGSSNDKAQASLNDIELIQQFKVVEQMHEEDKTIVKKLIDAFITKKKIQQLAS